MKKIAVLLSGCGVFDGSEIHEAVLSLLAITRAGAQYQCFAPDIAQMHVVNHLTGEVSNDETRNVLVESARIARGEVLNASNLDVNDYDGLVIPGGFGAAKNLSNFATTGSSCHINPIVENFIRDFANARKPVGFVCISPVMIPQIYGQGATGTIGNDNDTAQAFNEMGGKHQAVKVDDIVVDEVHKVVSTPAYMLATSILEAHVGIDKLVNKVIEMMD